MKKHLILSLFALVVLSGCNNNSPNDLIEIQTEVTYNSFVKNTINTNCLNCHSNPPTNGAPISLTTYQDVKDAVQFNGLINRITLQQGDGGFMPLGGTRLPQTTINQIIEWQVNGFPE